MKRMILLTNQYYIRLGFMMEKKTSDPMHDYKLSMTLIKIDDIP